MDFSVENGGWRVRQTAKSAERSPDLWNEVGEKCATRDAQSGWLASRNFVERELVGPLLFISAGTLFISWKSSKSISKSEWSPVCLKTRIGILSENFRTISEPSQRFSGPTLCESLIVLPKACWTSAEATRRALTRQTLRQALGTGSSAGALGQWSTFEVVKKHIKRCSLARTVVFTCSSAALYDTNHFVLPGEQAVNLEDALWIVKRSVDFAVYAAGAYLAEFAACISESSCQYGGVRPNSTAVCNDELASVYIDNFATVPTQDFAAYTEEFALNLKLLVSNFEPSNSRSTQTIWHSGAQSRTRNSI